MVRLQFDNNLDYSEVMPTYPGKVIHHYENAPMFYNENFSCKN